MGSFRPGAGNQHLHWYFNFTGCIVETVLKSLRLSCGSDNRKQCGNGCQTVLNRVSEEDRICMEEYFLMLSKTQNEDNGPVWGDGAMGYCPECGGPLILNNIYAEHYNENGYLVQWKQYTKWLQGTLNKKLLILELGVGMQFPSVIRWPFEKIAFFNQKAEFYRVNEKLYQLSEELRGKGISVSENAIDWLADL